MACGAGGAPERAAQTAGTPVRPGIEVAVTDSLPVLLGHRVGLVTNHTGIDAAGVSDVERLRDAGVNLVALFSPEHGFRGAAAPGESVATMRDSATGLPIYSLYGRTVAPTDSMLTGIDLMVVDLQDVGARYYTYISTAIEVMRAAGRRGIMTVILDRPNPIGRAVQGAMIDSAYRSFVGMLPVPMRHGLTMGELARFGNAVLQINAPLLVIPVSGWRPEAGAGYFDATGLPFVPPSPNLKSIESLIHYPGTCLFEGTNLSVGRGTSAPFEQVGAPWLDTDDVLKRLNPRARAGVTFEPVTFMPRNPGDGKLSDTLANGIRLHVTDRDVYDPTVTAVYLLAAVRESSPDSFRVLERHFDRLAGSDELRRTLVSGSGLSGLVEKWDREHQQFQERTAQFKIY